MLKFNKPEKSSEKMISENFENWYHLLWNVNIIIGSTELLLTIPRGIFLLLVEGTKQYRQSTDLLHPVYKIKQENKLCLNFKSFLPENFLPIISPSTLLLYSTRWTHFCMKWSSIKWICGRTITNNYQQQ